MNKIIEIQYLILLSKNKKVSIVKDEIMKIKTNHKITTEKNTKKYILFECILKFIVKSNLANIFKFNFGYI